MPEASTSHSARVDVGRSAVWNALQNPGTWRAIGPIDDVSQPRHRDDGVLSGFNWTTNLGGKKYNGTAKVTVCHPESTYGLRLETSEIVGDILTEIAAADGSTTITVTLTFRTKGMLSAMFFPAIKQAMATGFPQQVESFAASF